MSSLRTLLDTHRVLLCVGCGGVGKTTTCASLALAAARAGQRVLCLTIDPAHRLAESLGLEKFATEAKVVERRIFEDAGLDVPGELTVMMLDTKTTFDALVESLATDPVKRQRVFDNVLYRYISTSLAGTQEYMAMEKLYAVKDDPAYDLILLDTPPTSHALDFLDAPDRLVGAIDSAAVRWFQEGFQDTGKLSFNLLKKSAQQILKGIAGITGGGFLEQVASFVSEMNDLFGGWRRRADEVAAALRTDDVAYVLVTTPDPMSIREVLFFSERLVSMNMKPDAIVVNRVPVSPGAEPTAEALDKLIEQEKLPRADGMAKRVLAAAEQQRRAAKLARLNMTALEEVSTTDETLPIVEVPEFAREIHDVERLVWMANRLTR